MPDRRARIFPDGRAGDPRSRDDARSAFYLPHSYWETIMADHDSNPDPITGAPGSHPTGVGIGAAAGGATGVGAAMAVGAATGSVAGPIGTAIGIIAGAVVGGYVGKGIGEKVDPTEDENYWRENHKSRPYVQPHHDYDRDLAPAYRYGAVAGMGVGDDYDRPLNTTGSTAATSADVGSGTVGSTVGSTGSRRFEDYDNDFRAGWDKVKGQSSLTYDNARDAIRDAFDRRANASRSTTTTTGR